MINLASPATTSAVPANAPGTQPPQTDGWYVLFGGQFVLVIWTLA